MTIIHSFCFVLLCFVTYLHLHMLLSNSPSAHGAGALPWSLTPSSFRLYNSKILATTQMCIKRKNHRKIYSKASMFCLMLNFILFFVFLRLHPWHMEVPRLGVKWELQLLAYATATATWDPSRVFDLYHCSWQCQILNPLSKVNDQTCVLIDTSRVHYH